MASEGGKEAGPCPVEPRRGPPSSFPGSPPPTAEALGPHLLASWRQRADGYSPSPRGCQRPHLGDGPSETVAEGAHLRKALSGLGSLTLEGSSPPESQDFLIHWPPWSRFLAAQEPSEEVDLPLSWGPKTPRLRCPKTLIHASVGPPEQGNLQSFSALKVSPLDGFQFMKSIMIPNTSFP